MVHQPLAGGFCPQCGFSSAGFSPQGWSGTFPGWSYGGPYSPMPGAPYGYPSHPFQWYGTFAPSFPSQPYQSYQPFHPYQWFGSYSAGYPGWGQSFGYPTWGAGFQGPSYGWQPGMMPGFGLGGLRRWGGTYTPQFTSTGLPTDEEITEMIYDSIDADPLIPWDSDVNVEVDAGTVTLSGTVPNKRIKHAVGDDAWWIPGVIDVHNNLEVTGRRRARPTETPTSETQQPGAAPRQRKTP